MSCEVGALFGLESDDISAESLGIGRRWPTYRSRGVPGTPVKSELSMCEMTSHQAATSGGATTHSILGLFLFRILYTRFYGSQNRVSMHGSCCRLAKKIGGKQRLKKLSLLIS